MKEHIAELVHRTGLSAFKTMQGPPRPVWRFMAYKKTASCAIPFEADPNALTATCETVEFGYVRQVGPETFRYEEC